MEEKESLKNQNGEVHRANNVANGASKKKEKTFVQKFISSIIPSDVSNIKDYLILDVIIPTIKKAIVDAVCIAVYGETSERYKGNRVPAQKVSWRTDYNAMSKGSNDDKRKYATYDYDSIVFENKGAAEAVLSELDEVMDQFHVVSVLDLYDAAGLDCDYTANYWGWYDIRSAETVRTMDGEYMIKMPKARPIK